MRVSGCLIAASMLAYAASAGLLQNENFNQGSDHWKYACEWGSVFYTDGPDTIASIGGWGNNLDWSNTSLWQESASTFKADTVYTLSATWREAPGEVAADNIRLSIHDLSSDEAVVASALYTTASGTRWNTSTLRFDTASNPAVVGHGIGARFDLTSGSGTWVHLDSISLTEEASSETEKTRISPEDPSIQYHGRWNLSNPLAPWVYWQGASILVNFEGTGISADLEAQTRIEQYRVVLDGVVQPDRLYVNGRQTKVLASGLAPGVHTLQLMKETWYGTKTIFHGLEVAGSGLVEPPPRPGLRIEFFGDSNMDGSSSYSEKSSGNMGTYYAFPAMVTRMLGAEMNLQAVGGAKLDENGDNDVRSFIFSEDYYQQDPDYRSGFDPHIIVVNAGAADVGAGKNTIKNRYKAVIADLRTVYGDDPHIVLFNAYGWDVNEPAEYIQEVVDEVGGNLSACPYSWVWEQWHGCQWDHSGQAHQLMDHLAGINPAWVQAAPNDIIDGFGRNFNVANGGFEHQAPFGGFGWRYKDAGVERINDPAGAAEGDYFIRLERGEMVHQAIDATGDALPGGTAGNQMYYVSAMIRGSSGARAQINADTTSYDYDAPMDETGRITEKFYTFRDTIKKFLPGDYSLPDPPEQIQRIEVPAFALTRTAGFDQLLRKPFESAKAPHMEAIDLNQGLALYRTTVNVPAAGEHQLAFSALKDRAVIMVNGSRVATLDRRLKQETARIELPEGSVQLDILLENMGHLNYARELMLDRKGLGEVELDGKAVLDWTVYAFPLELDDIAGLKFSDGPAGPSPLPVFYRGEFTVDKAGDTLLDMTGWGKGMVWVNGINLGRFWDIGPQYTLYLPGCWMKQGINEVIVMDIEPTGHNTLRGVMEPIYGLKIDKSLSYSRKPGETIELSDQQLIAGGAFENGDAPQVVDFGKTIKARYVCIESLDSHSDDNSAAIAEIHLIDAGGQWLERDRWQVIYADSEEIIAEPAAAGNILDNQPVTFWHTKYEGANAGSPHPHQVVIDLGEVTEFNALRYLPRNGANPGKVRGYRMYASKVPFKGLK